MKGYVVLDDGTVFEGTSFGYEGASGGEIVFHTGMSGYQEILTDPSYAGQIVTMTYPMIGNYGVNSTDVESKGIFVSGFVVREYVDAYSNWRASQSLGSYLRQNQIVGVQNVDTRAITKKIRLKGSMKAVVGVESVGLSVLQRKLKEVPSMVGQDLASQVALRDKMIWKEPRVIENGPHVVVIDCGAKFNILRRLVEEGARVTVVPPTITVNELVNLKPKGILLSNGPGDPDAVRGLPETVAKMIGQVPIFGICLGHQILGLSLGAKTYKLKFGHHGANHPVRNEKNRKIEITSQNHGFAVDGESLMALDGKRWGRVQITHVHLSDETVEGFEVPELNVLAIQYHPEANPGPHDSNYLFGEFLKCIKTHSNP